MKDFGAVLRGIAYAALERIFNGEFVALDAHSQKLVVQDYLEAAEEDNCTARMYRDRIGVGNLRSYADVMLVRERKGWDR